MHHDFVDDLKIIAKNLERVAARITGDESEEMRKFIFALIAMIANAEKPRPRQPNLEISPQSLFKSMLRALPYDEYLKTRHWGHKRNECKARFRDKCAICEAASELEVHHRTYVNLGAEEVTDLVLLCGECHELFHKNRKLKQWA